MQQHSSPSQPTKSHELETSDLLNLNACGIDIGAASHWVSVPPEHDTEAVREFGCYTPDLAAITNWLKTK